MSGNPFGSGLNTSTLNLALRTELCQQIHAAAWRAAMQEATPAHRLPPGGPLRLTRLQQRTHWQGATLYLAHPADIDDIFQGVTLAVYRAIESLYCSRPGRSVNMVWRILDAMAHAAGEPPVSYEAVWAICQYLDERRSARCAVTTEYTEVAWWIAQTWPGVLTYPADGSSACCAQAALTCVIRSSPMQVLAFRIADEQAVPGANIALAIHDAIVSQRCPSSVGTAGLVWPIPTEIMAEVDVTEECREACAQMQINLQRTDRPFPLPADLRGEWASDLKGRPLRQDHLSVLFDNYLGKRHGHGPLSMREQQERKFAHQVGYNRDPNELFPALRNLLPLRHGQITADGVVECDGLHYANDLLAYWPGQQVTLRQSEYSNVVWVYLEDEVLCQAATGGTGNTRKA